MSNSITFSPDELHAYALAFKLQALAFYQPPAEAFVAAWIDDGLLEDWPLDPDSLHNLRALRQLRLDLAAAQPAAILPALRDDYFALFVGPDHVAAPPWESVYLSRDHLLFDEQTRAVRSFYAEFGLEIPRLHKEPDDHIGFELLFLAHLLERAAAAAACGDESEVGRCLTAARRFCAQHPQQWAPLFAARLEEHARSGYYQGLGILLLGSLEALAALLDRLETPAPHTVAPASPDALVVQP